VGAVPITTEQHSKIDELKSKVDKLKSEVDELKQQSKAEESEQQSKVDESEQHSKVDELRESAEQLAKYKRQLKRDRRRQYVTLKGAKLLGRNSFRRWDVACSRNVS
jgi:outer membrane murein-binding lipoprotein Lpp